MANEVLGSVDEKTISKMPGGSGKIQRSLSAMKKQMEMTDEEMKYRMENFDNTDIGKQYLKYLKCTSCNLNFQNVINKGKSVGVHPLLGVLLCDSCCEYYGDGNFSLDSEGEDKYCRWCGQGGTIFACSKCICGFCEECVKKHFGKETLEEVKNDDDWVCYFCNPQPLWYLRSICSLAREAAKNKREHIESSKEGKSSKKKKENGGTNSSSDTCTSTTDSIRQKQMKYRRYSKHKAKRDSSASNDEEVENQTNSRRRRRTRRKGKNESEESSSSDLENQTTNSKRKRRRRKKRRDTMGESSGSDWRNPKKRVKTSERNEDVEMEAIKWPLLDKLKSIWKLTQTATEVGFKSSRERLMVLQKGQDLRTMESLRKEHEELKSCISVLVSALGVASNSANSIGEDLKLDPAKDEREIFQSQEMELKRYGKRLEEEANVETPFDFEQSPPSKTEIVEEEEKEKGERKDKEETKEGREKEEEDDEAEKAKKKKKEKKKKGKEKEEDEKEKEKEREDEKAKETEKEQEKVEKNGGESEEGSVSGSASGASDEGEGSDVSAEGDSPAKPLLKVKSFARMLDENVYDKDKDGSVNGDFKTSEKSPVMIDLYDIDTEESESESQKRKNSAGSEKKSGLPGERTKKSTKSSHTERSRSSKGGKLGDVEGEEPKGKKREKKSKENDGGDCNGKEEEEEKQGRSRKSVREGNSSESEQTGERVSDEKNEGKTKRKMKRKEKSEDKNESGKESAGEEEEEEEEEEGKDETKKVSQSGDDKSGEASEEEEEEEKSCGESSHQKKESHSLDNDEKKSLKKSDEESKDLSGNESKEIKESENPPEKTVKNDSSSGEDSSGTEEKSRRITRNKKKGKQELKVSFAEFKEKRERFLKSSKGERKKVSALDSSDSEEDKTDKVGKKPQQKKKRVLMSSDEESGEKNKHGGETESSDKEESEKENLQSDPDEKVQSSGETSSDEMSSKQMKRKRVRKKRSSDSSERETKKRKKKKKSSSDSSGDESKKRNKGRKNIQKILKKDSLQLETKEALKNEEERKKRLKERQKLFEEAFPQQEEGTSLKHLILDFDVETKEPLVTVHKKLVKKLKPHQAKGVRFMWDNCFESVQRMEEDSGSGCILAHCMGLGKTLQVITLVHTVMSHDLGVNTVLIVCPLGMVSNWIREFEMWLGNIHTEPITLYDLVKYKKLEDRRFFLKDWQQSGGVLVTSYDLFRNMTKGLAKKRKSQNQKTFESALLDPGPDLVICDEGHLLKNEGTALSKCMNRVKTSRRIILTGTPLQNNLIEYHCMVQFVKPNILGTKKEFCNRFVNPISNGQFEDSTDLDVKIMKRRSHVLHSMLDSCIQRFDYTVLTPFLPEKHEYVLAIAVTETQAKVYRHFISNLSVKSSGSSRTASLFNDYHSLQRIWTHPRTLLMQSTRESMKEEADSEGSLKDFVVSSDEESTSSKSDNSDSSEEEVAPRRRITRSDANDPDVVEAIEKEENAAKKNWWDDFYQESAYDDLRESNKLVILFALLKHCREVKDKVLVFSQSLYSLDLIEYFLSKVDQNKDKNNEQLCGHQDRWVLGSDYFRLDGSTNSEKRATWCNYFNKESNTRARLFLLSTKAGGLGINLYGANRVVIFDASWNPSHDLQSIFRVYRFGQKKTCYVYRFLSEATMEEKIYERQVTKLSLAHRVVDEHQIERHYTMGNLQGLYTFEPTPLEARKVPKLPKDTVLADLLAVHGPLIVGYHEHDSLLENKQEEELSEEERKAAWKEYEEEKVQKTFNLDPVTQQLLLNARLAQGGTPTPNMTAMFMNSMNPGQSLLNPMFIQGGTNIPLAIYQRGMKVGLTPVANESLDSFFTRILNKESWMAGGQQ